MVALTGLTEETIAVRIRNLIDSHVIGITAVFDWSAAGYEWDAFVIVQCDATGVQRSLAALDKLEQVISTYVVMGAVDLVIHVLCEDRETLLDFVASTLPKVDGIRNVELMLSLDTVKYFHQFAWVPVQSEPLKFPNPVVELTELDEAIIDAVVSNGRASNREIGRALNISDATVRSHLRRMQDAGLLRLCAQVHPAHSGMVTARAFVGISVWGVDARNLAADLAHVAEIVTITITAHRMELFCYILAKNRARLVEIVSEVIRPMKGVRSTETLEVIGSSKHMSQWARW